MPGINAQHRQNAVASWVFGTMLLALLGTIVFILPEPSPFQIQLIRFFVATCAAFLSYFLIGHIVIRGELLGISIRSSGGVALFVVLGVFVDPLSLKTVVADVVPQAIPRSAAIQHAQDELRLLKLYKGPSTGVADSATRTAIADFQSRHGLTATGYLGPATRARLTEYSEKLGVVSALRHGAHAVVTYSDLSERRQASPSGQNESRSEGVYSTHRKQKGTSTMVEVEAGLFRASTAAGVEADSGSEGIDATAICKLQDTDKANAKTIAELTSRTEAPTASDIDHAVTMGRLIEGGNDRLRWLKAKAVNVRGYVDRVEMGPGDLAYCRTHDPKDRDTQIEISLEKDRGIQATYVIGEVTPQQRRKQRQRGIDWSAVALRKKWLGKPVDIVGWLLFDTTSAKYALNTHAGGADIRQATAWEIDPITAIDGVPARPILAIGN